MIDDKTLKAFKAFTEDQKNIAKKITGREDYIKEGTEYIKDKHKEGSSFLVTQIPSLDHPKSEILKKVKLMDKKKVAHMFQQKEKVLKRKIQKINKMLADKMRINIEEGDLHEEFIYYYVLRAFLRDLANAMMMKIINYQDEMIVFEMDDSSESSLELNLEEEEGEEVVDEVISLLQADLELWEEGKDLFERFMVAMQLSSDIAEWADKECAKD